MECQEIINQLIEMQLSQQERFDIIIKHFDNIASGLQIIIYILGAFFVWAVIKALYKLFGGIFLGV